MDTEMEFEAYSNLTEIQKFFYGQNVFLTGVTGLIGKVVLEKILRSCPGVGTVYLLMRPKKGLSTEERLDKMLKLEVFSVLKDVFPLFRKRIQIIEGDSTKDNLGMSFEDHEKIRQNVSIVIHIAASVQFNEPLKDAVISNLKGTKNVLTLCHELRNLKIFVHVSTAYVQRQKDGMVLEEIPTSKVDPQKLLEAMEWMDDKTCECVSDFLTEGTLTTYLITKALAELYIDQNRGDLPIAIVRPPYVGSTAYEPFPGWIDALQGLSGLLLAGSKGVLRTLQSLKGLKLNVLPVDILAHIVLASAWHVGIAKSPSPFIVNAVMELEKLPEADYFLPYLLSKRSEYPLVQIYRYPDFTVYYNTYAYYAHSIIDEWIPAIIIDFFLLIFTGKPILCRVYRKIQFLYGIFVRLGKDPWIQHVENIIVLRNSLTEEDKKIFRIDTSNFEWPPYIDACLIGGRKYLAKEDPSNIPYAKKKALVWWTVTTTLKWMLILFFLYYVLTSTLFAPLYKNIEGRIYEVRSSSEL